MKKGIKILNSKAFRMAFIPTASIVIGLILLLLVNRIPQADMLYGAANSINTLDSEGSYPELVNGYLNSKLDNYTDGFILNSALCVTENSLLNRALSVYSYTFDGLDPREAFMHYIWMDEDYTIRAYPRYWYGILIFIKPLLKIMSYPDIRVLISFLQIIMICALVYVLARFKMEKYIISVPLLYFYLMPQAMQKSIQYSSVFFIGMICSICVVAMYDKLCNKGLIEELFLFSGIMTSYFDLLTYPVFTLGIPLCFLLSIGLRKNIYPPLKLFFQMINTAISWGIGYIVMWAGKWIISYFVLGNSVVDDVLFEIKYRMYAGFADESMKGIYGDINVLSQNMERMFTKPIYKYIVIIAVLICILGIITRISEIRRNICKVLLFMPIIISPLIWYMIATEHSSTHSFFTFRTLSVGIFAIFSMTASVWDRTDDSYSSP